MPSIFPLRLDWKSIRNTLSRAGFVSLFLIPFCLPNLLSAQPIVISEALDFSQKISIEVEDKCDIWVPNESQLDWLPWEHAAEVNFFKPKSSEAWKEKFDGMTRPDVFWIKLEVEGKWEKRIQDWLISWNAYEVDMYWEEEGSWRKSVSGNLRPLDQRTVKRTFGAIPFLEIPLKPGYNVFYFRIKPGQVRIHERLDWSHGKLMTPAHYMKYDQRTRMFDSLILGLILALATYHLVIYFQVRRKEYLFFTLFGFSLVIFLLNLKDYSLAALWPNWPRWNYTGFTMMVGFLVFFTFARFSQHFLNMRQNVPRRNLFIDILLLISGLYILMRFGLEIWAPAYHLTWHPVFAQGIRIIWTLVAFMTFWAALGCYRHQPLITRRYLLTNALLVLVAFLSLLSTNGLLGVKLPFGAIALTIVVQQVFFALSLSAHIKEIERARNKAEQERQQEESKTRFFNSLTHELRTPLSLISGLAEQLEAKPKVRREFHLDLINRNVGHILNLTNLMLDLARISHEGFSLKPVHTDLIPLLKWVMASFEPMAEEKEVKLQFFSEQKRLEMDVDPQAMQQILINLVGNALKFTPSHGQVSLMARLERDDQLFLTVVDTGIGMTPDQVRQIFTPFYQVEDGSQIQHKGTGMGLAIVKELVSQMGGTIEVESKPEEGSSFFIRVPVRHEAEPVATLDAKTVAPAANLPDIHQDTLPPPPALDADRQLVLIVDDHWEMRYLIRMALAHEYNLMEAEDGEKALNLARKHMPDAIVSDVRMPIMDGNALLQQLRTDASTNHIPVLMLTAKATEEDRMTSFQLGADGYLTKPFKQEELLLRVARMTSRRWEPPTQTQESEPVAKPATAEEALIKEFEQIVRANFDKEHFDTQEFGRQVGLSRAQLHRKLKSLTGHAPGKFVTLIKMEQARTWLLTTDMQIQEIAWGLGMSDPSHFSRQYKSVYNETPRDTRQR